MGNHSWRCLLQVSWWNIGSFGETAGYCWRENERLDMLQYAAPSTQNFKLVCAIYSASIPKIVYQLVKWCNRAHSDLVICTPNLSFWVKSPPRQPQCWNWLHWTPLTYCPRASTYSSCKCLHPNFDGFVRSSHRVKFLYCVVNLWIIKTLASTSFSLLLNSHATQQSFWCTSGTRKFGNVCIHWFISSSGAFVACSIKFSTTSDKLCSGL